MFKLRHYAVMLTYFFWAILTSLVALIFQNFRFGTGEHACAKLETLKIIPNVEDILIAIHRGILLYILDHE